MTFLGERLGCAQNKEEKAMMLGSGYDPGSALLFWCVYVLVFVGIAAIPDIADLIRGRKPVMPKDAFTGAAYWLGIVTGGGLIAGTAVLVIDRSGFLGGITYYLVQIVVWGAIVGVTQYVAHKAVAHMTREGK